MTKDLFIHKKTRFDHLVWGLSFFTIVEVPLVLAMKHSLFGTHWVDTLFSILFICHAWSKRKNLTKWDKISMIGFLPIELIVNQLHFSGSHYFLALKLFRILECHQIFSWSAIRSKHTQALSISLGLMVIVHWVTCGWLMFHPHSNNSFLEKYATSLYWSVTTLATVGYGDITPTTVAGRFYAMAVMLLGVGLFGIVIGQFSTLIMKADRYKEEKRQKLHQLMDFLDRYQVPVKISKDVLGFYHHYVEKKIAEQDGQILSDLPETLQQELKLYMKIKFIREINFFKDQSSDCLRSVAEKLHQSFYSPGQVIVKSGDQGQEMFIISHGEVDVKKEQQIFASLKAGNVFGEIALMEDITRTADVVATSYVDIYCLHKDDFHQICENYPSLKNKFYSIYRSRRQGTKAA